MDVSGYDGGRLSESHVNFYRAFGHLIVRGMLSQHEMTIIRAESRAAMAERHARNDFDPSAEAERERRQWCPMMKPDTPFHAGLLEDVRFLSLATQLCADDVIGIKVAANRFGGSTPWHRDVFTSKDGGIKFVCYHEPVRRANGALRLLPLSQMIGDNYLFAEKLKRLPVDDVPCTALETDPGDVIVFNIRAWHGSFGGTERYSSDLSYYNNPRTEEEEESLRLRAAFNLKLLVQGFGGQGEFFYPRTWIDGGNPTSARSRWITRLREVGWFDAQGMVEPQ